MIDTSRMTDRSRKVMQITEEQARLRGATNVLPEHLLLGLALEGSGVAAYVLQNLGATALSIESLLPPSNPNAVDATEPLAWDDVVLQSIERAREEALVLKHIYIGTEHLVLGIALTGDPTILGILAKSGITPKDIHREVYCLLGHEDDLHQPDKDASDGM